MRTTFVILVIAACGVFMLQSGAMAANPCTGGKYDSKDCPKMKANANKRQGNPGTAPRARCEADAGRTIRAILGLSEHASEPAVPAGDEPLAMQQLTIENRRYGSFRAVAIQGAASAQVRFAP